MWYAAEGHPAGHAGRARNTASGCSRDWAAKGTTLLGVRAVIAESFERIHRSNLVGIGILPLQYPPGSRPSPLGSTGPRPSTSRGVAGGIEPGQRVRVIARRPGGEDVAFEAVLRIDGAAEVDYYRHGGILQMVLREMLAR